MSYINIKNYNKTIKKRPILIDINLDIEKGNIYGFLGRNGCGKTMLFRAICGLIKPSSGEVLIENKILNKDISFPQSLGVLIESPGFWSSYTGFENLKTLSLIKNTISNYEIEQTMSRVGLSPKDSRTYKKYSLGMKQRLGIAQAIMESPELIILDEPTNSLDEQSVELVRNILLEEKKRGATILIASHNKEDIEVLADYQFIMDNGKIINNF